MLNWLVKKFENKSRKIYGGIPIVWVIYKPELKEKNVVFNLHPTIKHDDYLSKTFKEIADYIRENYPEV